MNDRIWSIIAEASGLIDPAHWVFDDTKSLSSGLPGTWERDGVIVDASDLTLRELGAIYAVTNLLPRSLCRIMYRGTDKKEEKRQGGSAP